MTSPNSDTRPFCNRGWRGETAGIYEQILPELIDILEKREPLTTIKSGGARTVWTAGSSIGPLCIKDFHYPKPSDRLLRKLRSSRASKEWKRLQVFKGGGVPVPEPVLWAEMEGGATGRSVVITRYETDALSLDDGLRQSKRFSAEERRDLARGLGKALALMHGLGARHDDLHAGNLLITDPARGHPEVLVMDLHQVRLKRSLSWNERLRNLGRLLGGIREDLPLSLKHRFLKSYLDTLTDWKPPFQCEKEARRSMGRAIEFYAEKDDRKRSKSRVAKCRKEGKRFHRLAAGDYRGWVRAEWDTPELVEVLSDPNGWLASENCKIIKDTPTTTVARGTIPEIPSPLFVKRYNRKSLWERTKNLFRLSRSMKVWRSGYALEVFGIPTPEIVCALERRLGPLLLESLILTRWIDGGVGLDDFWRERWIGDSAPPLSAAERRLLRKEVAKLFKKLHDRRLSHGDLKGRNVLLDPSAPAPFSPRFVDLDAMSLHPIRFKRSRINDLSRLLFSVYGTAPLLTQVRFFREYCGKDEELWGQRRKWFKAIRKRTARKLREKGIDPVLQQNNS